MLTVGHSNRATEEFLQLLEGFNVRRIADIRRFPGSRHNPQFDRQSIEESLAGAEIAYRFFGDSLGGFRKPAPDSVNAGLKNSSFRGYADWMRTAAFAAGIDELLPWCSSEVAALMCAEALPWRCHRFLLSDALVVRDVDVDHILSPGETLRHELNPLACVEGLLISYRPPQAPSSPHPQLDLT